MKCTTLLVLLLSTSVIDSAPAPSGKGDGAKGHAGVSGSWAWSDPHDAHDWHTVRLMPNGECQSDGPDPDARWHGTWEADGRMFGEVLIRLKDGPVTYWLTDGEGGLRRGGRTYQKRPDPSR